MGDLMAWGDVSQLGVLFGSSVVPRAPDLVCPGSAMVRKTMVMERHQCNGETQSWGSSDLKGSLMYGGGDSNVMGGLCGQLTKKRFFFFFCIVVPIADSGTV